MAAARKKKPNNTRARAKKPQTRPQTTEKRQWDPVSTDITAIIIIAICVFLILSLFTDRIGRIGALVEAGFVGSFGLAAYFFPFIVIGICFYLIFKTEKKLSSLRLVSLFILFFDISVFAHILSANDVASGDATHYFLNASAKNGGFFGAAVGNFLVDIVNPTGAYLIVITSGLACLIGITGKSLFKGLAGFISFIMKSLSAREYELDDDDEPEPPPEKSKPAPAPKPIPKSAKKQAPKPAPEKPAKPAPEKPARPENDKKPSDYAVEIAEDARPQSKKIKLISEELSLNKNKAKNTDPLNEIEPPPSTDPNRPSVKLTMKKPEPEPFLEPSSAEFEAAFEAEKKIINSAPTPIPVPKVKPITTELPSLDEYIGEILFNNAPAYDETPDLSQETKPSLPAAAQRSHDSDIKEYIHPPIDLLSEPPDNFSQLSKAAILENSRKLEEALQSFKVQAKVIEVSVGPTVTRYELSPGVGVKVSSISNLSDDLALNLAAAGVRIEAPIPGKAAVGIEVPNKEAQAVYLREVIHDNKFKTFPSKLAFALGKDIAGNVVIADIARMPHMLIAGSTGSGKSVCINTLITSIIYKSNPDEVKLLMIDPKVVELKVYNGIPHLLIPVVTEPKKAAGALNWAVREMTQRYDKFAETSVRDLKGYNQIQKARGEDLIPQIVIIIDELSDLMMTAGKEVEEYICRLAQMARAAGIHLIIATQRPSVDVITGLIKANIPSKIAFAVSSAIDSRTIIGEGGAEKLLGRGDMLFFPAGTNKPIRVQGSYISDGEVEAVVSFVKSGAEVKYDDIVIDNITSAQPKSGGDNEEAGEDDEFIEPSIKFVVDKEKASASMLQRQFRIGYNRASRIIEILEERGIVGPEDGSKPRKVLMGKLEWEDYNARRLGL